MDGRTDGWMPESLIMGLCVKLRLPIGRANKNGQYKIQSQV